MKRSLMVLLVVTIGFAAVACSDGDEEALSKVDYIEQANAICAATNAEIEPIVDEFWSDAPEIVPSDRESVDEFYAEFASVTDDIAGLVDQQIEDLEELVPPAEDSEEIEALLTDVSETFEEMQQVTADAAAGDEDARERMDTDKNPMSDVNARAAGYGLTSCGQEL
jgi:methyl-accepting chemotaxis protein